jgi:PAS domain S-box-containing protein
VLWLSVLVACPLVEVLSFIAWPSGPVRLYLINVGQCASSLCAWILFRRLAAETAAQPLGAFWRVLSWGILSWFASNLVYMVLQTVLSVQRFPGWQDLFLVPAYFGILVAFLRLPRADRPTSARINSLIEAAALLLATLLVGWHFRLHEEAMHLVRHPTLETGFALLYPVADACLLWVLCLRAREQDPRHLSGATVCWLIGGLFALIIADFSMPAILVRPSLWGAGSLSDLGWGFFTSFWGLAAFVQLRRNRLQLPVPPRYARSRQALFLVVTSSWVVGMVLLLLYGLFTAEPGERSAVLAVGVVLVLILVSVRQVREVMNSEQLNRLVAELKDSREQFRLLFHLFPDAALLSGLEDGIFVEVNEGFTRTFGFRYEECVGHSALDLKLWVEDGERDAFVRELSLKGKVVQLESRSRRKDGTILPVEMSARLVEFDGKKFILNLVRDLSEKKAAQEHLRRNERELQRAQKLEAIGGLAGGIAHDVNNMLTPIMSGTELTLMELPEGHPSRPGLEQVLEASRRARDMVRQILTFSRRTEKQAERVDVGTIVESVLRQIRPQVPETVRVLHWRRSPPIVNADPTQIHQVLLNLCMNAVHALRDRTQGLIEIIEEAVLPDDTKEHGESGLLEQRYLHLSVRDTGCGMAPSVLERIFEPFYTTRRTGEGTGLGLAVVHGIVHQHGGLVKVYSSLGEGSIFHVYLPAAEDAAAADTGREPPRIPDGGGREIVCVDDDPMVLSVMVRLLNRMGYRAKGFGSGFLAEAYLTGPESGATEAVVCDFAMPEIDGISLAQRVGLRRGGLLWVLLSGYLSGDTLRRARAAGLEHFIDKPPTADQLARVLSQHFEEKARRG